jgi:uncharacterized membrane protein YgdD (TMEM256/DUF423 family)
MKMNKKITSVAAFLGMTAIVFGAFGAHALKKYLTIDQLSTFETAVKYQIYHVLFLLFVSGTTFLNERAKKIILNLTLIGVLLFSGSIYLLATKNVTGIDFKMIGFLTPVGGLAFVGAWSVLLYNSIFKKE